MATESYDVIVIGAGNAAGCAALAAKDAGARKIVMLERAPEDDRDDREKSRLGNLWPEAVLISARTGEGLAELQSAIGDALSRDLVTLTLNVPYDRGDLVSRVHDEGDLTAQEHGAEGTRVRARVRPDLAAELAPYAAAPAVTPT